MSCALFFFGALRLFLSSRLSFSLYIYIYNLFFFFFRILNEFFFALHSYNFEHLDFNYEIVEKKNF